MLLKNMRRIFHLQNKSDNSHKYYGSLSALCNDNSDLGVSKFKLDRFDFESGELIAGWKAANIDNFFCTKAKVENYIYDYYSLYTAQRTIAGATEDVEGNRTIAKTIEYLVAYHNM